MPPVREPQIHQGESTVQDRPDANGPRGADGEFSRRRFLRITGAIAGVSLAMPLLEACAPTLPAPAGRSATTGTATAPASSVYPTYLAPANAPKADFPAESQQYDDAFDNYPKNPVKALPAEPPGTGGNVKIMSIQLFPPPTPYAQNPAWQAVNKELNANVQFEIVTSADYPVKLGTMMASSDLPDLIYMYARPGSNSALAAAAGVPQFLQAQAADLTPYLAGDAAKDYPYLAAIPTPAWKNSGSVYQGRLYMVPIHRYLPGQVLVKNVQVWDKEIGAGYVPKNAADFKRILQTLTKPQQDFYGIGGAQGTTMLVPRFAAMFGAPNGWKLDNGKLTKDYETAEFKEAVNYVRDLWASGVFHPNSLNYASNVIARQNFAASRFAVYSDPFNGWQDGWRQALQSPQPFDAHMIPPFAATRRRQSGPLHHRRSPVGNGDQEGHPGTHARDAAHSELAGGAVRQRRGPAAHLWRQRHRLDAGRDGQSQADTTGQHRRQLRPLEVHHPASIRLLHARYPELRQDDVRRRARAHAGRHQRSNLRPGIGDQLQQGLHPAASHGRRHRRHRRRPPPDE